MKSRSSATAPQLDVQPTAAAHTLVVSEEAISTLDGLLHRLTQPITALRGLLELSLLEEPRPRECRKTLREALAQTERLSETVNQMKKILDSLEREPGSAGPSWAEAVGRALTNCQPLARSRNITIIADLEETERVQTPPGELEAVTQKCLSLLLKRSPVGSTTRISLRSSGEALILALCGDEPPHAVQSLPDRPKPAALETTEHAWNAVQQMMRALRGSAKMTQSPPHGWCWELRLPRSPKGRAPHDDKSH